jgi:hypothetical protein
LDEGAKFLGAKHTVIVGTNVRHPVIQPSLRDLCNGKSHPRLKPWAILKGPSGPWFP